MSRSHSDTQLDGEVDAFVQGVSKQLTEVPLPPDEVPEFLRVGEPDPAGWFRWRILPITSAPWLTSLEASMPVQLPPALRSLLRRYSFPALELKPLSLFANTGQDIRYELRVAMKADRLLSKVLSQAGFVHFGRAPGGRYDPVCFDIRKRTRSGDFPVVLLDHEEALIHERANVTSVIAPSFRALLASLIAG